MLGLGDMWSKRCGVSRLMWEFVPRTTIKSHVTSYYIQGVHLGNGSSGFVSKIDHIFSVLVEGTKGSG